MVMAAAALALTVATGAPDKRGGRAGRRSDLVGGYVAGPDAAPDYVRSYAPGFIFTTSLPQACMDATPLG
ncbi:hypothetical protein [Streptosporangium canum]|uniref:hypothetical protein n=1 Tax=Streptosporangium canum TaxID=324952 RepID=UPI0034159F32